MGGMTPQERLSGILAGERVDRPPFWPAIYDLKASLAGVEPHLFGTSVDELVHACSVEAEDLEAEILTVGYDIYNVEVEALGAELRRESGLGMPEPRAPVLRDAGEAERLEARAAGAAGAGRMGVFVEAAAQVVERYGNTVPVRGGVSGPFSMPHGSARGKNC